MLVVFGANEAGCFREVAALYSDNPDRHYCTVFYNQCSQIERTTSKTPLGTPKTGAVRLRSGRVSTCGRKKNQLKRVKSCSCLIEWTVYFACVYKIPFGNVTVWSVKVTPF